jgi:hypothetical protein
MIKGSCLCHSVTYVIDGDIGAITHCHCETCRKAHGSAFASVSAVQDADFHITQGQDVLKSYESSPGKQRYFCNHCGSQIYAKRENTQHIILRLGTLDDDPATEEKEHIWTSQQASWYQIDSHLPQHDEF